MKWIFLSADFFRVNCMLRKGGETAYKFYGKMYCLDAKVELCHLAVQNSNVYMSNCTLLMFENTVCIPVVHHLLRCWRTLVLRTAWTCCFTFYTSRNSWFIPYDLQCLRGLLRLLLRYVFLITFVLAYLWMLQSMFPL